MKQLSIFINFLSFKNSIGFVAYWKDVKSILIVLGGSFENRSKLC